MRGWRSYFGFCETPYVLVQLIRWDGRPIECLHPVEAIGVNGLHAVVVAPVLVRVEMLRKGRTYELLNTQHQPGKASEGKRPPLETKVLFRGIHGRLELDLSGKDKNQAGSVVPAFYSLAGEEVTSGAVQNHHTKTISRSDPSDYQGGKLRSMFASSLRSCAIGGGKC
jgi:hypothetical protein